MADVSIPREAVDKAAHAYVAELHNKLGWKPTFDELTAIEQHNARETAAAMLNAAVPHLDVVAKAEPDEVDSEQVAYWGEWRGLCMSFVSAGPDGRVDLSYAPFSRRVDPVEARAMAAQLLAAAKYAESFCGGCEKTPCVCEPDQGGEYPCTNCGTTGWDCLTQMNSTPEERRCCHRCPYIDGHKRPARQEQS